MNIALVNNRYFPAVGGSESVVKSIAEGLVERGHNVKVITSDFESTQGNKRILTKKEMINGVEVIRLSGMRFWRDPFTILKGLGQYLKQNQTDLDLIHVFTYGYQTSWLPLNLRRKNKIHIPVVFSPHYAPVSTLPKGLTRLFDNTLGKQSIKSADKILLLTQAYKDFFTNNNVKVEILEPIVEKISPKNTEDIKRLKAKFNIQQNDFVILSLSRIEKYKGILELIKAFAKASNESTNLKLVIAGKGPFLETASEYVKTNNISNVIFTGYIDDTDRASMYHLANVFALLSYSGESFGLTLIEAMQAGLPILASKYGAIPFVVEDNENGLIVDPFDTTQVATAITNLYKNPSLIEKFSKSNIEKSKNYSKEKVLAKLEEIYSGILKTNQS